MDRDWMINRLEAVQDLIDRANKKINTFSAERKQLDDELERQEPTLRAVLNAAAPGLGNYKRTTFSGWAIARSNILQAIGHLRDAEETARRIEPDAPALVASGLHPWVWEAAKSFWDSEHYAQAVEEAWKSINAHVQTKVGRRDIADDGLMTAVLSESPPQPGRVKLVLPGDRTDLTWKSRQRGLQHLAQACAAGLRNVVAHVHGLDLDERDALEYLATLSVLARWIEETKPEHGD